MVRTTCSVLLCASVLAGCSGTGPVAHAPSDCKIAPLAATDRSATGARKPVSGLEQRYAGMQLASTQFRYANLARNGPGQNLVEDVLRDCDAPR